MLIIDTEPGELGSITWGTPFPHFQMLAHRRKNNAKLDLRVRRTPSNNVWVSEL